MPDVGTYLREEFERLVEPIDTDALIDELVDQNAPPHGHLRPLERFRLQQRSRRTISYSLAAAVLLLAVGTLMVLLRSGGPAAEVIQQPPLPVVSSGDAAVVYAEAARWLAAGAIQERRRCEASRLPEDELIPANVEPRPPCDRALTEAPIIYIIDHPVNNRSMTLGFCADREFDRPMCRAQTRLVHTASFDPAIREAIASVFPSPDRIQFVASRDAVTVPADGIIRYEVINGGEMIELGPLYTDGEAFYVGVGNEAFWVLRVAQSGDEWTVDLEMVTVF